MCVFDVLQTCVWCTCLLWYTAGCGQCATIIFTTSLCWRQAVTVVLYSAMSRPSRQSRTVICLMTNLKMTTKMIMTRSKQIQLLFSSVTFKLEQHSYSYCLGIIFIWQSVVGAFVACAIFTWLHYCNALPKSMTVKCECMSGGSNFWIAYQDIVGHSVPWKVR